MLAPSVHMKLLDERTACTITSLVMMILRKNRGRKQSALL